MSDLFQDIKEKLPRNLTIVLPEGTDERILAAAQQLSEEGIIQPILLGKEEQIIKRAQELAISLQGIRLYDPSSYVEMDAMVEAFVQRRKGKVTAEDARSLLQDENYFGTMLVYLGKADGLVSGAAHTTADTVRPALQIIKTKPGCAKTSGSFIMVRKEERYIFGDCAINISPSSQDLAEIAIQCAKTAEMVDVEPRVALLSFSTKGSAVSPETEKVVEATAIAKELAPDLCLDGEFQFDAAFVPSVAEKKAPDSVIKGDANVFIFPTIEAGNIGYKIAQRLGGFEAVGPILQGLNKPVNDLSRGCNADDVYKLCMITALQTQFH